MAINPKNLFFIDSLGAMLSVILLGVVLPSFQPIFGMPEKVLSNLAAVAVVFNIYSFLCYVRVTTRWRLFLGIIAVANTLYCLSTLLLTFYYFNELTIIGVAYFVLEIPVIGGLAYIEFKHVFQKDEF